MTQKTQQQNEKIVQSLLNLKEELWERSKTDDSAKEWLWKVNSCLFREYPTKD